VQIIVRVWMTAREYVERGAHRLMQPCEFALCPRCDKAHGFEALGYYERWVTDEDGVPVRISVRRFVSRICAVTISCLPDFCQPYRLLNNRTIADYMAGELKTPAVSRGMALLGTYRRRFQWWCECRHDSRMGPGLRASIGDCFGRSPPDESPGALWARIVASCGQCLNKTTGRLVQEFRLTLFGRYQCHQPRRSWEKAKR
jgi:hypothetical protein